jgi:energy-coupling factor transporter transmembrane protein EcfT
MNKYHPVTLLVMSVLFMLAIFFKLSIFKISLLFSILAPYLVHGNFERKKWKVNLKRLGYIVFAISMLVILKLFYTSDGPKQILEYSLRMFYLFSISMLSFLSVDFDKLFIYLMASDKIKTIWGYPLLLAINSLQLLKEEQERISFNAKLRGLKWHQRYLLLFPLLVFAIRHSERGAMALSTRGLNPNKLYYQVHYPSKRDRAILTSYFLLTLTFFLVG